MRNSRKEHRIFNYAENGGFNRAKTEVPFCTFLPEVNLRGYMKITYSVLNSSLNPANVELSSFKNSTILAFSTVSKMSESESIIAETLSSELKTCDSIFVLQSPVQRLRCKCPLHYKYFDWSTSIIYRYLIGPFCEV